MTDMPKTRSCDHTDKVWCAECGWYATPMPETPAECLAGITMSPMHRSLIIARIEYLIAARCQQAALDAIEQFRANATRALVSPITQAEIEKAS